MEAGVGAMNLRTKWASDLQPGERASIAERVVTVCQGTPLDGWECR